MTLPSRNVVSALISNPSAAAAAERERLLGVSVLLREPQVFEGVLLVLVHDHPLDCSVADCEHKGETSHQLDPVTPPAVHRPRNHYKITGFDEFVGLQPSG